MSKKRRKLKSAVISGASQVAATIDLRDVYLPYNSDAAIVVVDDPLAIRDFATLSPAERTKPSRDGAIRPEVADAAELRATVPKREVLVSLRDSPLWALYAKKRISKLQYEAGARYRADVDTSMIGGARAIDYSRPAVDGGQIGNPLRDATSAALDRLRRADIALGHAGKFCCRCVLGEGVTVSEYARRIGRGTKHGHAAAADFFRSCLDILAEMYGLATRRAA